MTVALVDVGGSDIKYAFLDQGKISSLQRIEAAPSPEDMLSQVVEIASETKGLALALPGTVKPSGTWSNSAAYNLMGQEVEVRAFFSKQAIPLLALSQDVFASGRGLGVLYPEIDRMSLINLGTGLGGSVVVSGWPWSGLGQEIGHLQIMSRERSCFCGKKNCLEASAGWGAISARNPEYSNPLHLARAASSGDARALSIIDEALEAVALAAAIMSSVISGQNIFLLGGVADTFFAEEKRMHDLRDAVEEIAPSFMKLPPLLRGPGARSALVGLASLSGEELRDGFVDKS